jgi:hypothetical protein
MVEYIKKNYAQLSTLGHIMLLQTAATLISMSVAQNQMLFYFLLYVTTYVQTELN